MIRVCLFSEDRTLEPILSSALGKDFQVQIKPDEAGVSSILASGECDVVLLDLDSDQNEPEARLKSCQRIVASHAPSVVMVDDRLRSEATDLVRLGAHSYCRKPPSVRDLKTSLRRAHETSLLKRKLDNVQQRFEEVSYSCDRMIGRSSSMQQVYDLVRRVANINASVLVTGESGTGKELIAQAIHNLGSRSQHPFVAVCCGAIPETLIEAELFGHEKGAFTGTVGSREGYLEQAGNGTLFLDEIGELSLSTQVKLLRVLQQREFSRLGSNRLIPLRARLIFATHQDLANMVAEGRFRQDLYYRINVMRIDAPSLHEHAEDIPTIARHFLHQYSEQYGKLVDNIDPDAMALLQGYSWPGNVRELENTIQRAIIVAKETSIFMQDLPGSILEEGAMDAEDCPSTSSFERQIRDFKLKLAVDAVREHNGNKTLAARSLQISRAYLHRLIRPSGPALVEESTLFGGQVEQLGTV
ncbi:MAG TPA: sigma-54 dependent transcriptional regulator [Acidobacteriaceae bacterium]|jgi:DNA-binding NtrC family response regulator